MIMPATKTGDDAALEKIDSGALHRRELIKLATEVACNHEDLDVILQRKGITKDQYEKILKNPFYARVLQGTLEDWNSPLNAERRTQLQAALLLEHTLVPLWGRINDRNEPLPACIEGVKVLAKVAGMGERARDTGEKFTISIDLGGGKAINHEITTIEASAVTPEGEPTHEKIITVSSSEDSSGVPQARLTVEGGEGS